MRLYPDLAAIALTFAWAAAFATIAQLLAGK